MNKFIKVLCVILAVLMLVGMATACKKGGEEDEFDILEGGGTVDENGDDTSDDSTDSTETVRFSQARNILLISLLRSNCSRDLSFFTTIMGKLSTIS